MLLPGLEQNWTKQERERACPRQTTKKTPVNFILTEQRKKTDRVASSLAECTADIRCAKSSLKVWG